MIQHHLRPYAPADCERVLALYRAAVRSQCLDYYSPQQVSAWADHARADGAVAQTLQRGWALVNPVQPGSAELAAFGVLEPMERLSLLYCDGRWSRQGRGGALLQALERHALSQGVTQLRTEASQLSRPLLLRHGWQIEAEETVLFAGVSFVRWRMIKSLLS